MRPNPGTRGRASQPLGALLAAGRAVADVYRAANVDRVIDVHVTVLEAADGKRAKIVGPGTVQPSSLERLEPQERRDFAAFLRARADELDPPAA
jgi:hypothetical protein